MDIESKLNEAELQTYTDNIRETRLEGMPLVKVKIANSDIKSCTYIKPDIVWSRDYLERPEVTMKDIFDGTVMALAIAWSDWSGKPSDEATLALRGYD